MPGRVAHAESALLGLRGHRVVCRASIAMNGSMCMGGGSGGGAEPVSAHASVSLDFSGFSGADRGQRSSASTS